MSKLLGWRKVIVVLVAFVTSIFLLVKGLLSADQWVSVTQWILPAFFASNLMERWANGREKNG